MDEQVPEQERECPSNALCFAAEFELGERKSAESKSAPFKMLARTSDAISHWYWGKVAHDLDGFRLTGKTKRLSILFQHDPSEVVGYANRFEVTDEGLMISGALTPTEHGSGRALEIIELMEQGVPYEASIGFAEDGRDVKVEVVDEGASTEVNGKKLKGPAMVFRSWPLREASVVTSGADGATDTSLLSSGKTARIQVINGKENTMSNTDAPKEAQLGLPIEIKDDQAPKPEAVELEAAVDDSAPEVEETVDEAPTDSTELTVTEDVDIDLKDKLEPFVEAFGVDGLQYAYAGHDLGSAMKLHVQKLTEENEELKQRLSADQEDGEEGVSFSPGTTTSERSTALPLNIPK